jgi:AcrR family transcriptional regulator
MAPSKSSATDTRRDRSRQAIVTATSKVLSEKGLNLMTVEDILKESGVARATFYSHFSDKNEATAVVVEQMFQRAEQLYASFHQIPSLTEAPIAAWLANAFDQWQAYHAEVSSLVRDFTGFFKSPQFSHLDRFAEILVSENNIFACDPHTAQLRARLLIVQLERAMLDTASGAWPFTKAELIQQLTPIWMDALHRR